MKNHHHHRITRAFSCGRQRFVQWLSYCRGVR
jgi:hypothetical protein